MFCMPERRWDIGNGTCNISWMIAGLNPDTLEKFDSITPKQMEAIFGQGNSPAMEDIDDMLSGWGKGYYDDGFYFTTEKGLIGIGFRNSFVRLRGNQQTLDKETAEKFVNWIVSKLEE